MSSSRVFTGCGLLVAIVLALFVSPSASSAPDGLEKVAADQGFAGAAKESPADEGPLAGYSVQGVKDEQSGTGIAGLIGTLLTFGLAVAVLRLVRAKLPSGSA
jgi:hypothetical protein